MGCGEGLSLHILAVVCASGDPTLSGPWGGKVALACFPAQQPVLFTSAGTRRSPRILLSEIIAQCGISRSSLVTLSFGSTTEYELTS